MDINSVKEQARLKMKGFCGACKVCDGNWCAGQVPGMGGTGSGSSFKNNYESLKNIKFVMKTIHDSKNPVLKSKIFGKEIDFPVLGAPITGTKFNMGGGVTEEEYCIDVIEGCKKSGTIGMIGDTGDPACFEYGLKAIEKNNGYGIAIIKPRENSEIIKRIKMAEKAGVIAVGVDLDGAGLVTMKLFGQPVGPKTIEDLKELVRATKLPFIAKGIMSVEEAKMCIEAGVDTIVVSNHGGRVLDYCQGSADVLEDIVKAVGDKINVLADGCVRSGADVLKYLALGAKGVLVGRPLIWGSIGGRVEGVEVILNTIKNQLFQNMILTGSQDVNKIEKTIIKK
ncbi:MULTISPECIES: alpha-hydroxy-acid oxidizing protein [Fusobacterium]|jgi:4-hydroxymandelate oxidase|uniref:Alpha-hydroxy-acid oxidizing protein n=1 Tax=Fusobacterium hominis TaxID=2764326 RepID=A0A7G9GXR1_9FUSO|nr:MULTISPECIES: alpha-hydroxy-acid oxidizing protein [Fusobacterium]QNM15593.1 alpha-hydroxy-acid oxidizing protein [Fusobacterium hominis]